jgi:NADPH-dependent curcumin reductase CurA
MSNALRFEPEEVRMASLASLVNHQFRLASRPVGLPTRENWRETTEPVAAPPEGGLLVKTLALSLVPAMRGWMSEAKSYIAPVAIDAVMRAGGVGQVMASRSERFSAGEFVYGFLGVQEYCCITSDDIDRQWLTRIDLCAGSITQWLNVLGNPGMTGYFGLMEVGQPKAGETLVVSGASGAVGQTVGQLARIKGLRVVGIAGGSAKCDWVVGELGFDACIDYKAGPSAVADGLRQHCPDGIDIYFDNVGGEILDAALERINRKARIVICGAISQYNNATPVQGPKNYLSLLVNRARMEGMLVADYVERFPAAVAELAGYLKDGRMKSREDVVVGLERFPEALPRLFKGENFGKLVLQVADPQAH